MASTENSRLGGQTGFFRLFPRVNAGPSRHLLNLVLGVGLLTSAGCGTFGNSSRVVESVDTNSNQRVDRTMRGDTIVSRQTPVQLRLPRNWQAVPNNNLHPTADIQAYNSEQEIYLIVLGENQQNVTAAGDLNRQAQIYLNLLKNSLNRVITSETATQVETVNGLNAVQYELQGEIFGAEAAYLHTTVEMNDRYYQVVAWTPTSRFDANFDEMQNITQAFGPE